MVFGGCLFWVGVVFWFGGERLVASEEQRGSPGPSSSRRTKVGPLLARAVHELAPLLCFWVRGVDKRQDKGPARDDACAARQDVVPQQRLEHGRLSGGL